MESLPPSPDQELLDAGWIRRFSASGDRLQELVQAYKEAGFEVRVEGLAVSAACSSCSEYLNCVSNDTKLIYTRKLEKPQ